MNKRASGLLRGAAAWSVVWLGIVTLGAAVAWAQAGADDPPEILTSELALKTVLEADRLNVDFVIVDTDKVTQVTIDGQPQKFEPSDTVQISHTFEFRQDVTSVVVSATDEKGHTRTVTYTVFRPGVDPAKALAAQKPAEEPRKWFASYDARFEQDTNPSLDLSLPFGIKINGFDPQGVVPDSRQKDTRRNVSASGGVLLGHWTVYGGASVIRYSKVDNEQFNVQTVYLGGSLDLPTSETSGFLLAYTFSDVNLGAHDYSQVHTLSPSYRNQSSEADGGTGSTVLGLDVSAKRFASDLQDSATDLRLVWDFSRLDNTQLDRYRRTLALGKSSEGLKVTEYSYFAADWDWMNRWEGGLLFDIGTGFQYRSYPEDKPLSPETPLGSKRVDIPGRFSTGIGWQFRPALRLMLNYQYLLDLSNKAPYVRQIYGIGLNGTF